MNSELAIDNNGNEFWRLPNGELHRENGPAIEWTSGHKWWFLNGVEYCEQEYKVKMRSIKLKKLL